MSLIRWLQEFARRQTKLELIASGVFMAWCLQVWTSNTRIVQAFSFDDAFITLRYARNLALHGVLSFNLDDRVDGFTSPGWTACLAVALRLGANGEVAMRTMSWVAGLAAVVMSAILARRLGSSLLGAITVGAIGTASVPGFVIWSVPGMEMPYAAAIAASLLATYTSDSSTSVRWVRAVIGLLAVTARPECIVLVVTLLTWDIWGALRAKGPSAGANGRSIRFIAQLRPQIVLIGVALVLFSAHWAYYGYPLPNTFYAKRSTPALAARGARDLADYLGHDAVLVAIALSFARVQLGLRKSSKARVGLAFAIWACATLLEYSRVGGDFVGYFRYYQPLVPSAYAILAATLFPSRLTRVVGLRSLCPVALAGGLAWFLPWSSRSVLSRSIPENLGDIGLVTQFASDWREVGFALRDHFPRETILAVRAAGIIPWITDFKTIDLLALNNSQVAHSNKPVRDVPGHQLEASEEQVIAWHPDIVVGHPYIVERDLTGHVPAPPSAPHVRPFLAAGYVYECTPLSSRRFVCFWRSSR